ncbi:ankyrin, variant [Thecamonas trahens ATCC 50062]|uniref:Ankyrin, variant n=1 Tax=Thecamonas trahens ATCC 50062 TaxID=461836 RepID=A0A0L0DJR6_THETB|nr:ankyrin, variant [Thecamonas trahens ATCC 50062]KNC52542.1 ankyrin, variant [Thecamonas trahens ATCC 50062]|eukprot:XP_013755334.1 ankyrin, variant [Thecamonas trahens ATCC 50062]
MSGDTTEAANQTELASSLSGDVGSGSGHWDSLRFNSARYGCDGLNGVVGRAEIELSFTDFVETFEPVLAPASPGSEPSAMTVELVSLRVLHSLRQRELATSSPCSEADDSVRHDLGAMDVLALPASVVARIASLLPIEDLLTAGDVCLAWRERFRSNDIWRQACRLAWGRLPACADNNDGSLAAAAEASIRAAASPVDGLILALEYPASAPPDPETLLSERDSPQPVPRVLELVSGDVLDRLNAYLRKPQPSLLVKLLATYADDGQPQVASAAMTYVLQQLKFRAFKSAVMSFLLDDLTPTQIGWCEAFTQARTAGVAAAQWEADALLPVFETARAALKASEASAPALRAQVEALVVPQHRALGQVLVHRISGVLPSLFASVDLDSETSPLFAALHGALASHLAAAAAQHVPLVDVTPFNVDRVLTDLVDSGLTSGQFFSTPVEVQYVAHLVIVHFRFASAKRPSRVTSLLTFKSSSNTGSGSLAMAAAAAAAAANGEATLTRSLSSSISHTTSWKPTPSLDVIVGAVPDTLLNTFVCALLQIPLLRGEFVRRLSDGRRALAINAILAVLAARTKAGASSLRAVLLRGYFAQLSLDPANDPRETNLVELIDAILQAIEAGAPRGSTLMADIAAGFTALGAYWTGPRLKTLFQEVERATTTFVSDFVPSFVSMWHTIQDFQLTDEVQHGLLERDGGLFGSLTAEERPLREVLESLLALRLLLSAAVIETHRKSGLLMHAFSYANRIKQLCGFGLLLSTVASLGIEADDDDSECFGDANLLNLFFDVVQNPSVLRDPDELDVAFVYHEAAASLARLTERQEARLAQVVSSAEVSGPELSELVLAFEADSEQVLGLKEALGVVVSNPELAQGPLEELGVDTGVVHKRVVECAVQLETMRVQAESIQARLVDGLLASALVELAGLGPLDRQVRDSLASASMVAGEAEALKTLGEFVRFAEVSALGLLPFHLLDQWQQTVRLAAAAYAAVAAMALADHTLALPFLAFRFWIRGGSKCELVLGSLSATVLEKWLEAYEVGQLASSTRDAVDSIVTAEAELGELNTRLGNLLSRRSDVKGFMMAYEGYELAHAREPERAEAKFAAQRGAALGFVQSLGGEGEGEAAVPVWSQAAKTQLAAKTAALRETSVEWVECRAGELVAQRERFFSFLRDVVSVLDDLLACERARVRRMRMLLLDLTFMEARANGMLDALPHRLAVCKSGLSVATFSNESTAASELLDPAWPLVSSELGLSAQAPLVVELELVTVDDMWSRAMGELARLSAEMGSSWLGKLVSELGSPVSVWNRDGRAGLLAAIRKLDAAANRAPKARRTLTQLAGEYLAVERQLPAEAEPASLALSRSVMVTSELGVRQLSIEQATAVFHSFPLADDIRRVEPVHHGLRYRPSRAPMAQMAVQHLGRLLFGASSPVAWSTEVSIRTVGSDEARVESLCGKQLVSRVAGIDLARALRWYPQLVDAIDIGSFSRAFVMCVLAVPDSLAAGLVSLQLCMSDGKLTAFVAIDDAQSGFSGRGGVRLRSILLCMPQMLAAFEATTREVVLAIEPALFVLEWLGLVTGAAARVSSTLWGKHSARMVYSRLVALQRVLQDEESASHLALLNAVSPTVGALYSAAIESEEYTSGFSASLPEALYRRSRYWPWSEGGKETSKYERFTMARAIEDLLPVVDLKLLRQSDEELLLDAALRVPGLTKLTLVDPGVPLGKLVEAVAWAPELMCVRLVQSTGQAPLKSLTTEGLMALGTAVSQLELGLLPGVEVADWRRLITSGVALTIVLGAEGDGFRMCGSPPEELELWRELVGVQMWLLEQGSDAGLVQVVRSVAQSVATKPGALATFLALEVSHGRSVFDFAVYEKRSGAVRRLLEFSPSLTSYDTFGYTPLHRAAAMCAPDLVQMLLEAYAARCGSHVSRLESHFAYVGLASGASGKRTALHYACESKSHECVQLLLSGVGAVSRREIVRGVGANGEDLNRVVYGSGEDDEIVIAAERQAQLELLARPELDDHKTPLHICARQGDARTVRLLLEAGAPVNALTEVWGYSALHFATKNGFAETVVLLVQYGAKVFVKNANGDTPVDLAFRHGRYKIMQLFIDPQLLVRYVESPQLLEEDASKGVEGYYSDAVAGSRRSEVVLGLDYMADARLSAAYASHAAQYTDGANRVVDVAPYVEAAMLYNAAVEVLHGTSEVCDGLDAEAFESYLVKKMERVEGFFVSDELGTMLTEETVAFTAKFRERFAQLREAQVAASASGMVSVQAGERQMGLLREMWEHAVLSVSAVVEVPALAVLVMRSGEALVHEPVEVVVAVESNSPGAKRFVYNMLSLFAVKLANLGELRGGLRTDGSVSVHCAESGLRLKLAYDTTVVRSPAVVAKLLATRRCGYDVLWETPGSRVTAALSGALKKLRGEKIGGGLFSRVYARHAQGSTIVANAVFGFAVQFEDGMLFAGRQAQIDLGREMMCVVRECVYGMCVYYGVGNDRAFGMEALVRKRVVPESVGAEVTSLLHALGLQRNLARQVYRASDDRAFVAEFVQGEESKMYTMAGSTLDEMLATVLAFVACAKLWVVVPVKEKLDVWSHYRTSGYRGVPDRVRLERLGLCARAGGGDASVPVVSTTRPRANSVFESLNSAEVRAASAALGLSSGTGDEVSLPSLVPGVWMSGASSPWEGREASYPSLAPAVWMSGASSPWDANNVNEADFDAEIEGVLDFARAAGERMESSMAWWDEGCVLHFAGRAALRIGLLERGRELLERSRDGTSRWLKDSPRVLLDKLWIGHAAACCGDYEAALSELVGFEQLSERLDMELPCHRTISSGWRGIVAMEAELSAAAESASVALLPPEAWAAVIDVVEALVTLSMHTVAWVRDAFVRGSVRVDALEPVRDAARGHANGEARELLLQFALLASEVLGEARPAEALLLCAVLELDLRSRATLEARALVLRVEILLRGLEPVALSVAAQRKSRSAGMGTRLLSLVAALIGEVDAAEDASRSEESVNANANASTTEAAEKRERASAERAGALDEIRGRCRRGCGAGIPGHDWIPLCVFTVRQRARRGAGDACAAVVA